MNASATIKKFGLEKIFDYMYKNPEKNLRKLLSFAEKHAGKMYPNQLKQFRDLVDNPENPYHDFVWHILRDVDPEVVKTVLVNFLSTRI